MMTRSLRTLSLVTICVVITACSQQYDDLKEWIKLQDNDPSLRNKVDPLPDVQTYEPFTYNAAELPDPFTPRKIEPAKTPGTGLQPDLTRRKEALEGFPLEGLSMVGTIEQNKIRYALVKGSDGSLHKVKAGNYLGQNFGVILAVNESSVKIKEIIQDGIGGWVERESTLQLADNEERKK